MSNASDSFTQRMPSAAIGGIVFAIVAAFTVAFVWISERPSLPAVTGEAVIETVEPADTRATTDATEDPNAPVAFIEESGGAVTPDDQADETTVTDVELSDEG